VEAPETSSYLWCL